jgi:hypothetical protein
MSLEANFPLNREISGSSKEVNNKNEPWKVDQYRKNQERLDFLRNHKIYVNSLDFKNLNDNDLCSLYKVHIKKPHIKSEIESLTDSIESCYTTHPDLWDINVSQAEHLKETIMSSLNWEIDSLDQSDIVHLDFQNSEGIRAQIEKDYPGVRIDITDDFVSRYGEVYHNFMNELERSLEFMIKKTKKSWQMNPLEKEKKKFHNLSTHDQVLILFLFDHWVRLDELIWDERWDLWGYLNLLISDIIEYKNYLYFCETAKLNVFYGRKLKNYTLDSIATEIVDGISPSLKKYITQDFIEHLVSFDVHVKDAYKDRSIVELEYQKNIYKRQKANLENAKESFRKTKILFWNNEKG